MDLNSKLRELLRSGRIGTDVLNRGLVAGTLGAPVDMINMGVNAAKAGGGYLAHKAGLINAEQLPELDDKPVGGSEWIGQKMEDAGMVSKERRPLAEAFAGVAGPGELMAGGKMAAIAGMGLVGKVAGESKAALTAEQALKGFGTAKAEREAAWADKREKQLASGVEVEKQEGKGEKGAQSPFVFRERYNQRVEDQGLEYAIKKAIQEAKQGVHLKPRPSGGGWVGAPGHVLDRNELKIMRKELDQQLNRATTALQFADPTRVGNWYERAKAGQASIHEPHQLDRGLEQTSVYSAGVDPQNETGFKLKHWNSRALDTGEQAYRGPGMRTLDTAVADFGKAQLAPKVGEYRGKNDPRILEHSPFGVNDFRMAQAFGYMNPQGKPWKAGVYKTMHPVMDLETALLTDRANKREAGGRSDWTGAMTQELPWVLNKAEDIYGRGKDARFAGGDAGKVKALIEANKTMADFLPKHTGTVPGTEGWSTPGQYQHDMPHWDSPYGAPRADVGAGDRDALYRSAGFLQLPTTQVGGQTAARPLMDFKTKSNNVINPNTIKAVGAIEDLRSTLGGREGGRMDLPVTMNSRKGKDQLLLSRDTPFEPGELDDIGARLDLGQTGKNAAPSDMATRHVDQGVLLSGKAGGLSGAKLADAIRESVPGARVDQAAVESVSVPGVSPPSKAGKGIATKRVLDRFADAPPALGANVSESEEVRRLIGDLPPSDRADVMKTRGFFKDADWNKVVRLMREKGLPAAAAMGALGFSLQGMAAERER